MSNEISKSKVSLSQAPSNKEIRDATAQLVDANSEGTEACNDLDLLIKTAEAVSKVTTKYKGKVNYARSLLMDIALKL